MSKKFPLSDEAEGEQLIYTYRAHRGYVTRVLVNGDWLTDVYADTAHEARGNHESALDQAEEIVATYGVD